MARALSAEPFTFEQTATTGDGNPYDGFVTHHFATLKLPGRTLRASDSTTNSHFSTLDIEVSPCTGREWLTLRDLLRRELGAEHDRCSRPWLLSEVAPALAREGERDTALALARESLASSSPADPGRAELAAWLAGSAKQQVLIAPAILEGWLELEREGTAVFEALARLCPFDLQRWKGAGLTPAPWFAHPAWPLGRAPEAIGTWRSLPRAAVRACSGLAFAASDALSGWELTKDWTIVAGEPVPQTEGWSWHVSRRARYPEDAALPVVHVALVGLRQQPQELLTWSWLGGTKTGDVLLIVERKPDPAGTELSGLAYTAVGSDEFRARADELLTRLSRGAQWVEVPAGQWEAPAGVDERVLELERWLKRIRHAFAGLNDFDLWERWGASSASPEHAAKMQAQYTECRREEDTAKAALDALIVQTRADNLAALEAWAARHDALWAAHIAACEARDEGYATADAKRTRERWAELSAGTRNFFDDSARWPSDRDHYRRLFGMDP